MEWGEHYVQSISIWVWLLGKPLQFMLILLGRNWVEEILIKHNVLCITSPLALKGQAMRFMWETHHQARQQSEQIFFTVVFSSSLYTISLIKSATYTYSMHTCTPLRFIWMSVHVWQISWLLWVCDNHKVNMTKEENES